MKGKTLGKVIEKISFKAVIAMAMMFTFVALNSKAVQAKTYNSGETAYVEEIEEGDIINKGVIITSKSDPKRGFQIWFYNGEFVFGVNTNTNNDRIEQVNNNMDYSWEVGTIPEKTGGTKPSNWDEAWPVQVRTLDPDDPGIFYSETNNIYMISFEEPQIQPHEHSYTSYTVEDGNVILSRCDTDGCVYYDGKAELVLEPQPDDYFYISLLDRFNDQTGLNVSKNDVEIYKVETEDATEGGKKVTGIPKKAGYYYASLTVQGVTAKKAFTIEPFEWIYNNAYGKKLWYTNDIRIANNDTQIDGLCNLCSGGAFIYDKVNARWTELYTCNHFITEEPHVDDDGNLDSPMYESLGSDKHKVVCGICGAEYGELLNHNFVVSSDETSKHICTECGEEGTHDFSKYVSLGNGKHKVVCKTCDIVQTGHENDACNGTWRVAKQPTVLAAGVNTQTCSLCKGQQTTPIAKLTPTIKLSKTKLSLKKGKSASIKVSQLANGDSVKSWKTSNKKVATVSNKGKIKAKKKGKVTITVTLASGLTAKVKVTVK